jgi:hypothetical protein
VVLYWWMLSGAANSRSRQLAQATAPADPSRSQQTPPCGTGPCDTDLGTETTYPLGAPPSQATPPQPRHVTATAPPQQERVDRTTRPTQRTTLPPPPQVARPFPTLRQPRIGVTL